MSPLRWPGGLAPVRGDIDRDEALRSMAAELLWTWRRIYYSPERIPQSWAIHVQQQSRSTRTVTAVRRILHNWVEDGRAEEALGVAAGEPRRCRVFDEAELRSFLARVYRPCDERVEAFRQLIEAGEDVDHAYRTVKGWRVGDDTLPSGQWIPAQLLSEALRCHDRLEPGTVMLPTGLVLSAAQVREVVDAYHGQGRIQAIKKLRKMLGADLRTCLDSVGALVEGGGVWADAGQDSRVAVIPSRPPQAEQRLYAAIDELLCDRPLFWVLLSATSIRRDDRIPTMAVGMTEEGRIVLFYNRAFVLRISRDHCKGVLVHEINHVLLGHLGGPPAPREENPAAWNAACEVTANEFVPYPLPGNAVTLELLGLPPGQSTMERYRLLMARDKLPEIPHGHLVVGRLRPDPRDSADHTKQEAQSAIHALREAMPLVGDEISSDTAQLLGGSGDRRVRAVAELLIPEDIEHCDWDLLLKKLARTIPTHYRTRSWPNRRQPQRIGIVPGRRRRMRWSRPCVVAAVDTSASMASAELAQVAAELGALTRRDTRVILVQCDTEIREERAVRAGFELTEVKGRGGTDLRPPFGRDLLARHQPDLLVYFTDGYGPAPDKPPPGVEVLWVLTGKEPATPAPWGRVVCMLPRSKRSRVRASKGA